MKYRGRFHFREGFGEAVRLLTDDEFAEPTAMLGQGAFCVFSNEGHEEMLGMLAARLGLWYHDKTDPIASKPGVYRLETSLKSEMDLFCRTLCRARVRPDVFTALFMPKNFVGRYLLVRKADGALVIGNEARRLVGIPEWIQPFASMRDLHRLEREHDDLAEAPRVPDEYFLFQRCQDGTQTLAKGEPVIFMATMQDAKVVMRTMKHLDRLYANDAEDENVGAHEPPAKRAALAAQRDAFWDQWDAYTSETMGMTMVTIFPRGGEPEEEGNPPAVIPRLVALDFEPDDSGFFLTTRSLQETSELFGQLGIRITQHFPGEEGM